MPRRSRRGTADYVFHVFNRVIQGMTLFDTSDDYDAFLRLLASTFPKHPDLRLFGYALMPTHWHLVVWPRTDACLSQCMHRLSTAHARRWREARGNAGRGAVYQGRFKAIPVQESHFLRLMHYVERNPVSGRCAASVLHWPWTSAVPVPDRRERPTLHAWPVPKPLDWAESLEVPAPSREVREIRRAVRTDTPLGDPAWRTTTMETLHWTTIGHHRGRPRKVIGRRVITDS